MKPLLCLLGIHKYINIDSRGRAGRRICIKCGDKIEAIKWPPAPTEQEQRRLYVNNRVC